MGEARGVRRSCFLGIGGSVAGCRSAGRAECARGRSRVAGVASRCSMETRGRRGKGPRRGTIFDVVGRGGDGGASCARWRGWRLTFAEGVCAASASEPDPVVAGHVPQCSVKSVGKEVAEA